MSSDDTLVRVDHPGELREYLEALCEPGGVSLVIGAHGEPLPVVLSDFVEADCLLVDISAVREVSGEIGKEKAVRLVGQARNAMLSTPPLILREWVDGESRRQCRFEYPDHLLIMHRRDAFRAELGAGMGVAVALRAAPPEDASLEPVVVNGMLKNLSLGGCLVEAPLTPAMHFSQGQRIDSLELIFPNQQRFMMSATLRHMQSEAGNQLARLGCEFVGIPAETERRLWLYVREIERESARKESQGDSTLKPSPLFAGSSPAAPAPLRAYGADYPTPMARRLAKVAAFLNAQLLQLLEEGKVDATQLSRHADLLLGLLEEDREAVLFAVPCLVDEPLLIQHGIGVAVRLADLARSRGLPRDICKAVAASALVHDLGKALLPAPLRQALRQSTHLSDDQRHELWSHVALIQARLEGCRWLAPAISQAVIGNINERLDGSGYPRALAADSLDEVSRMAAVVDAVDAMSRPRADRRAHGISEIYRHLLTLGDRYDRNWVQAYVRHFGLTPVGSLARFKSGELGWVQRLDRDGRIQQVQLTSRAVLPGAELGEVLTQGQLDRLGAPEALVVPKMTREIPLF
ncbi:MULTISPECIES: HD domain-containing phosphohydrolase [Halomonadaceae]|uniref:HD domain-containing phosphohydrolase n=1 Tax=Halomonadaceae TaxID=28256 RepID=UPI0015989B99|nr:MULTISPECIES: HD domain-containing phosphohydrolase [Halomonas]QJQ95252.1 HD family phosphohydrolase [Halomonas sp. PA5]